MSGNFHSGVYKILNKNKYLGETEPKVRSSWEKRVCNFCDNNVSVKRWGFEIINIPYLSSIDMKQHKYITDFYCEILNKQGKLIKYILEVKPSKQTIMPKIPKNKTKKAMKNYMYETEIYVKNQDKWKYATAFCKSRGLEFKIITEKHIF